MPARTSPSPATLSDTHHPEWLTVIGVVADFKGDEIHNRVEASAYLPYPYLAVSGTGLIVRGRVRPAALAPLVRQAVHAADPALPVGRGAVCRAVAGRARPIYAFAPSLRL